MKKGLFLILIVCLVMAWGLVRAEEIVPGTVVMPTIESVDRTAEGFIEGPPALTFSFSQEDLEAMSKQEARDFMLLAIYTKMELGNTWEPLAKKFLSDYLQIEEKVEKIAPEESQQNQ